MITVYIVDKHTRLHMPNTEWAARVLQKLRDIGYAVERTTQSHIPDLRDAAELERRDCLIAETGL